MIPRGPQAPHLNFPEFFVDPKVEPLIRRAHLALQNPDVTDIVLNFEKCQWFEILPLARLFALFCCQPMSAALHVVAPALDMLPYYHHYTVQLQKRLKEAKASSLEVADIQRKIEWFSERLPQLRRNAGAFLFGWSALDLLHEHCERCRWYLSRSQEVSLAQLRQKYLFSYGSSSVDPGFASSRVWPFSLILENDREEFLGRINGEEILAGPLRSFARSHVVQSGSASNIFFFEPFENVFQHAYSLGGQGSGAVVSMRTISWLLDAKGKLKVPADRLLRRLPSWYRNYLVNHADVPLMEIVIADAGAGIARTIESKLGSDVEYRRKHNLDVSLIENDRHSWELVRYAFEPHSTQKEEPPPGFRGLSWVKAKIAELGGGLIHVTSSGVEYVLADYGGGLQELSFEESNVINPAADGMAAAAGTAMHVILPLRQDFAVLDRSPRWLGRGNEGNLSLWQVESRRFQLFYAPTGIGPWKREWEQFLEGLASSLKADCYAIIDLGYVPLPRGAFESFFEVFVALPSLHGRLVVVNCDRHVTSRLDTVSAGELLAETSLVIPFFEPDMRLYWVGASPEEERLLLQTFWKGSGAVPGPILASNRPLFQVHAANAVSFAFGIEEVENVVRLLLGRQLAESLARRRAIHNGRFILPISRKTVTMYIEPHQIFVDGELASRLCRHLAVLLRRRFRELAAAADRKSIRVLTATRIGRDIAMWMPEGYPRQAFIFFDYHIIRPEKPRLLKHLRGKRVVIVVDIISTGGLVEQLLAICSDAGAEVLGVLSFIDLSPTGTVSAEIAPRVFFSRSGEPIEHLTFWRSPQQIFEPEGADQPVDPFTLSLTATPATEVEEGDIVSVLSPHHGLRLLSEAGALRFGHFDLFGRHYEFATNLSRLFAVPSVAQEEIYRACEEAIFPRDQLSWPTGIVLYPDLSNCHILQAPLMKRPKVRREVLAGRIRFEEARRGSRAFGRRYWLTSEEIRDLREWATAMYPSGFAVLVLDDAASSGETLLAMLELARLLQPQEVRAFVIINRMPRFRAGHHQEIERFAWATSKFSCLFHLNIPAYSRENCPLCKERGELLAEVRAARSDWFRSAILRRVQDLEISTVLHPHDLPSGPLSKPVLNFQGFSWDSRDYLGSEGISGIARAVSARLAIHKGVPLLTVFGEVSDQPSDEVWRVTLLEIARRTDLQQAQHVEQSLILRLLRVLSGRNLARRTATLEALRYFRPETLLPRLDDIVAGAISEIRTDDLATELILLVRRVLSYRHLQGADVLEKEAAFATMIDQNLAYAKSGSKRYAQLSKLQSEWVGGRMPHYSLVALIRDIDRLLHLYRRPSHRLLSRLRLYIGNELPEWCADLESSVRSAIKAIRMATFLVSFLSNARVLIDGDLEVYVQRSAEALNDLRRMLVEEVSSGRTANRRKLIELVDNVADGISAVETELLHHTPNPLPALEEALSGVQSSYPDTSIKVHLKKEALPLGVHIIIDQSLYAEIVQNLVSNLRHAVDSASGRLEAVFEIALRDNFLDRGVRIRVQCKTRAKGAALPISDTTTRELAERAEFYGVERHEGEELNPSPDVLWDESWTFSRL